MPAPSSDATRLLVDLGSGDTSCAALLLPLVYDELRELAGRYLRAERGGHTLQPTALVHEAYLRLIDQTRVRWQDRTHFVAVAAMAMRRILVNHARDRGRLKRGGAWGRVSLENIADGAGVLGHGSAGDDPDLVALDEALDRLGELDPRKVRVVEMRYFAGMSPEETAEALGVSLATVKRDWTFAKAWLLRSLRSEDADGC